MDNAERTLALRRRTKQFAGSVVRFYVSLDSQREEISILSKQLLRSGTSVGANYREASRSRSDAEFIAKIELRAQEADETQYWLELKSIQQQNHQVFTREGYIQFKILKDVGHILDQDSTGNQIIKC